MRLSPLHKAHEKLGAVFFNFHGWNMPLHYGSQLNEHNQVRKDAGVFDVSHMLPIDITGSDAYGLLERLLSRNIARCHLGKGLYTLLLNEQGGVIDDVIVYKLATTHFRIVVNAGNRAVCIDWLKEQAANLADCHVEPLTDYGILALQGPRAIERFRQTIPEIRYVSTLAPFHCNAYGEILVTRTGYTGEAGIEVIAPASNLLDIWERLIAAGVMPIGLGARDSLRLEAGLPLYGLEMDQDTPALSTAVRAFIDLDKDRDFMGKSALITYQKLPSKEKQTAIALYTEDKGIPRTGDAIKINDETIGNVTSGCYSPVRGHSIAMGRIHMDRLEDLQNNRAELGILCRKRLLKSKLTSLPFITKTNLSKT